MTHQTLPGADAGAQDGLEDKEQGTLSGLDRRTALRVIGGLFGTALVAGCGGGGGTASSLTGTGSTTATTATTTTGTTTTGTTLTPSVTPEGEIGPYFADDSAAGFNRSNVLANLDGTGTQAGIPLTLKLYVYDAENGFAPLAGAQVDIWHCNASGVYSDEAGQGTTGQTWLRGYQITDSAGLVMFNTIMPGWYQGRATHIHLRVRSKYGEASSTSDGTNTTQLFFSQTVLDYIYTNVAPYNTKGKDTTTNASDHVYTPRRRGRHC